MKKLLIFLGALAAYGQTVSLSDTLTNAVGGGSFTGRITVTLNAPASAQPLYYSTTSLTGWQAVYCIGVTGADCTTTTSAGTFAATLYANSTITPAGTSYSARFQPTKGAAWSETWTVEASDTKLYQVRSTTVPSPTVTFQPSQLLLGAGYIPYGASAGYGTSLAPGTNGHVLTLSAGYPSWATPAACATCVVTSGSYADPAWITSLAGSKISGAVANATLAASATALAANGANCAAGTFPLGVDASGAAETCTALPTTVTGTANQITASASTGAVTLSLPATITGLTSVTSTSFTGALTGNATTATALASSVPSGRLWIGNGTGAPTSDSVICADTTTHRLGVGICSPAYRLDVAGGARLQSLDGVAGQDLAFNTANTYSLTFAVNSTEAFRVPNSRNLLIGTTTDLGYGLHGANKGTNGNFLCFDPTATTGTTKCLFVAGQGQSGNILEVRAYNATPGIGTLNTSIGANGNMSSVRFEAISSDAFALQTNYSAVNALLLRAGRGIAWSSDATWYGTVDASLSRSAANTLQVGDGGANANGTLKAAALQGYVTNTGYPEIISAINTSATNGSWKWQVPGSAAGARNGSLELVDYGGQPRYTLAVAGDHTWYATAGNKLMSFSSAGLLLVYNDLLTTGNTKFVVKAGQGQSTNLTEWQSYAGTAVSGVSSVGNLLAAAGTTALPGLGFITVPQTGFSLASSIIYTSINAVTVAQQTAFKTIINNLVLDIGSQDVGLSRNAAGVIEVNNVTAGTYRDLRVRSIFITQSTPAASSDACTAGALWADASYVYACTASGVIKRATLAAF